MRFLLFLILFIKLQSFAQNGWSLIPASGLPLLSKNIPGQYLGVSWIDIDNDNDIDIFAAPNKLYLNNGLGSFTEIDTLYFAPIKNNGVNFVGGSSWADLNDDGFLDCIVASEPSRVFKNNGNNAFTDVSAQIPNLNNIPNWGCAIGDWNKDKYLDFYFAHASGFHSNLNTSGRLYLNTTSSLTPNSKGNYAITDSLKPYTVPYWSDFDLDGDMDLFVASGPGGAPGYDYCYKNLKIELGTDSLQRMTNNLFTQQKQDGQCYNFVDFDNDQDLDLCLTNYSGAQSRFYINNSGTYSLHPVPWNSNLPFLSNCWGDYDNDGDLDMITTSDGFTPRYFRNNGNSTFTQIVGSVSRPAGSSGIANGDYDNDGDLDVLIHGTNSARALFRNDTLAQGRNWVNFKLTGSLSNKSAIGAIVKIVSTISLIKTYQLREVNAQNSFQSQNDLRVHFGLGNSLYIDSVYVRWPSGVTQTITNVMPNKFYSLLEGSNPTEIVSLKEESINQVLTIYPNPATKQIFIQPGGQKMPKEFEIYSLEGKKLLFGILKDKNIDVSKLSTGTYVIHLSGNGINYNKKIIIQ